MRITSIETIPVQIPLKSPFKTSKAEQKSAKIVLVKLHTDKGIIGIGECDPRPHITGETVNSVTTIISDSLGPALRGMNLSESDDIAKICDQMDRMIVSNPSAKAGIDIALYDALGKQSDVPIHALLGDEQTTSLISCGFSDLGTAEGAEREASKCRELGGTSFKIKVGGDWTIDAGRVAIVRSTLDTKTDLIIDPNQAWSVDQSIQILNENKRIIAACEQPIEWNDLIGLSTVTERVDVPIVADEAVQSPFDASVVLRLTAADMVNIKHLKSGGLYHACEIARLLQRKGLNCMIGSTMESGVSSAASVHLGVACPNLKYFDVAPPTDFLVEDITEGLEWDGLNVEPPDQPGLGITLRDELVRKYTC